MAVELQMQQVQKTYHTIFTSDRIRHFCEILKRPRSLDDTQRKERKSVNMTAEGNHRYINEFVYRFTGTTYTACQSLSLHLSRVLSDGT